ncbi:MAG: class I SAM-dependent methyltransferase [Actinobacteria bacterium]|nr:class I SAM-dependent methyltransferase [Actinomycetota bacterium]
MTKFVKNLKKKLLLKLLSEHRNRDLIAVLLSGDYSNPHIQNEFSRLGYYFLKKHYYLPIPEKVELDFLNRYKNKLIGLNFSNDYSFWLLGKINPYLTEFRKCKFTLLNGTFMAIDAHIYYSFIRLFKPKKIIEIGAGNSTKLAQLACLNNKKLDNHKTKLFAIDPYPLRLNRELKKLSKIIKKNVQEIPIRFFESLEANDILFLDSTHVLKPGGDVQYEFLEIIPRLKPGVLIHIHDISLPKPYPGVYFKYNWFWNEQYLLQAFLAYNNRYEIIWPGNYLMIKYPKLLKKLFPEFKEMREKFPNSEPTSFWIRVNI